MDRLLKDILYILYDMKIRPGDVIKQYRRAGDDIKAAIHYFKYNKDPGGLRQLTFSGFEKDKKEGDTNNESARIFEYIKKHKLDIMYIGNKDYPSDLLNIFIPPPVLYYRGKRPEDKQFNIAIVGSRRCSHYGREVAAYLSRNLSRIGITIVSGLALGIDASAHTEAVKEKGGSIAVLGNGPDIFYPPENRSLYREIEGNGTVITEFSPGTPPLRTNFPIRNRIISGLCKGVIIIEAGQRSGAMITGELALSQDREVFAVPGNIFSPGSRGCHKLIKSGAKLIECIDDILDEFKHLLEDESLIDSGAVDVKNYRWQKRYKDISSSNLKLDTLQSKIFETIGSRPKSFDEISIATGLEAARLLKILSFLEIKNMIREDPLNHYRRCK
ncbi:DNA-processing protein DprA [Actinomycetota bacterium]